MSVIKTFHHFLITGMLIAASLNLSAQGKLSLSGKIVDLQKNPISYLTVVLIGDSATSIPHSRVTDSLGRFIFGTITKGYYKIEISSVGYKKRSLINIYIDTIPVVLSDSIVLEPDSKQLNQVTVIGKKPYLEYKVDRLIVNVGNSLTSVGATAIEILKKVPGVIVVNDRVSLSGKTGVVIMIDGKPSPYTDMEAMLKDIPGNNIEDIEVINNPGAQFEASGSAGIINIVLKKNQKAGLNGTYILGSGYSYYSKNDLKGNAQSYGRYSSAITLTYNRNKWIFFGNADLLHRSVFEVNNYDRIINGKIYNQKNYYPYDYNTITYRSGANYQITKKSSIGILINGNQRSGDGRATTFTNINDLKSNKSLDTFTTNNLTKIERFNLTGNLNYSYKIDTAGQSLNADVDYSTYKYNNTLNINIPDNNTNFYQAGKNPLEYFTFKSNYTYPLPNGIILNTGLKFSNVNIQNKLLFTRNNILDSSQTNTFLYDETVQAAYINAAKKFSGFEYQVGLRVERTSTKGELVNSQVLSRQYVQLFPSLSMRQKISEKWDIDFAYSRRIDRPQFVLLSPFSYFIDSLTYSRGNPNLIPQLTHATKLTLHYNHAFFLAFNYNHTKHTIYESAPQQVGIVTFTQPENLGLHENAAVELNVPILIGSLITGYGDIQGIYNSYNASYLNSNYRKYKFSLQSSVNIGFNLSPTLKAEINGFYTSGALNEFMSVSAFSGFYFGLQKSILKKKGTINFSANDIFYKNSTVSKVNYQNINTLYFYRDDSQNFRLTLTYVFGYDKHSKQSNHDISSEEENNRLRN